MSEGSLGTPEVRDAELQQRPLPREHIGVAPGRRHLPARGSVVEEEVAVARVVEEEEVVAVVRKPAAGGGRASIDLSPDLARTIPLALDYTYERAHTHLVHTHTTASGM